MARVGMTRSAVSHKQSAHSAEDNVTTPYDPIRLLKGAPPGQVKNIDLKFKLLFLYKNPVKPELTTISE